MCRMERMKESSQNELTIGKIRDKILADNEKDGEGLP